MHALVSTARFLLLVDLERQHVEIIENDRSEYYGITWRPNSSELILSHSGLNNADLTDVQSYANSEVGYLSQGADRSEAFLSAPHQIISDDDGRVICTNTGRNRIQIVEFSKPGVFQEFGLTTTRWDRLSASSTFGEHLNSVFLSNGLLYVIAHGHNKGSKLAIFNYPELTLVSSKSIPNITGLHNVMVGDHDQILSCHSSAGGIMDLVSNEILWRSGSAVYTRGLAASDELLFIGESAVARREERASSASGLWVVRRDNFQTEDYIYLGPYGAVHEVRLVDVPDAAHHGVPLVGGVESVAARLSKKVKKSRLESQEAFCKNISRWDAFDIVMGNLHMREDDWYEAQGNLVLMVGKKASKEIAVEYDLNSSTSSGHVSLIAGYQGMGVDASMDAFLLQATDDSCFLRRWRHNGVDWAPDQNMLASSLPLRGIFAIRFEGERCLISLDGQDISGNESISAERLSKGQLGIRLDGASIRPLAAL